jgi:hypothetical protein
MRGLFFIYERGDNYKVKYGVVGGSRKILTKRKKHLRDLKI